MTTEMTHNRIKSVQQAITGVLVKRANRGATMENLEAYKVELLGVWVSDSMMKDWIVKLDVKQYVK